MSEIAVSVLNQVIIMALYIAVGFVLTKCGKVSGQGTRQMSFLLVNIVTPCVIVMAFQNGYDVSKLGQMLVAFAVSIGFHIVAIPLMHIAFAGAKDKKRSVVSKFCAVYSNCGFMGIPLLQAALGDTGVFIGSAYLAVFNVFVWTHGYSSFNKGNGDFSYTKAVLNPGVVGVALAAVIVLCNIKLPPVIYSAVNGMSALNTPVAMILLGIYLGESKLLETLKRADTYIVCVLRLVLLPLITVLIMAALSIDTEVAVTIALSASCPCAAISAIFAAQFDKDSAYASAVVALSTLLSLVTLPIVSHLSTMILMK